MRKTTDITILLTIALLCLPLWSWAYEGTPFVKNFSSDDYKAHNRNFDVVADEYGNVFFANFEGLLYYNGVEFQTLHTPGISRLTTLTKDKDGRLLVGGYNVLATLDVDKNGRPQLKSIISDKGNEKIGEVTAMTTTAAGVEVTTLTGTVYLWDGKQLTKKGMKTADDEAVTVNGMKVNHELILPSGERLLATVGNGIVCMVGRKVFELNSSNGLCSDNVNKLAYSGNGRVWGATDNGIFCLSYPSAYTHYSLAEGLEGEVLCIVAHQGKRYVGTMQGLFVDTDNGFQRIGGVKEACWQLTASRGGRLYAATANGLMVVDGTQVRQLTPQHTLSVLPLANGNTIVAELKGVYEMAGGTNTLVCNADNVTKLMQEGDSTVFMQDIYGKIYERKSGETAFREINKEVGLGESDVAILFDGNDGMDIISNQVIYMNDHKKDQFLPVDTIGDRFTYPSFVYTDENRYIWFTDNNGKNITPWYRREIDTTYTPWLQAFDEEVVRAMYVNGSNYLFGVKDGIIHWHKGKADAAFAVKPQVYIRCVTVNEDSVVWGGLTSATDFRPKTKVEGLAFGNDYSTVGIHFSTALSNVFGTVKYRYRMAGDRRWSAWTDRAFVNYTNMRPGGYTFEVQAKDCYGRLSPVSQVKFKISWPWFLRWWCILLYLAALVGLVYLFLKWRTQRLLKETQRLEGIVSDRTAELRQQKEQVEEKSKSLEVALNDLAQAQSALVRQEKMATAGKLTKGLIDRILNPINYINNFSHLTQGLSNDVMADIEDEKENISEDTYEDLADVLDMIKSNLGKIVEHGTSTSRILKAMEEMLKERVGKMSVVDLADICRQDMDMLRKYYEKEIAEIGIATEIAGCDSSVEVMADGTQLSKSILSMLGNSIYAVKKKYGQSKYDAKVRLEMAADDDRVTVTVYDNGIGIEDTIKAEVFEPFFTTKTTAEASGVGLYLAKEVVEAHEGTIEMESEKNEYTKFIITLKRYKA